MAKFQIIEVFRLPKRRQFVIAGKVMFGEIRAGMNALVLLDSRLHWSIPITAIEFIDRIASKESLVGLVCQETTAEDAALCQDLCEIGTEIEVTDAPIP
jgi:hypothetical protein